MVEIAGIEIKNAAGQVTISITDRLLGLEQAVNTTPNVAGSFTLRNGMGTPWFQVSQRDRVGYDRPQVTLSGNVVSWSAAPTTVLIRAGRW